MRRLSIFRIAMSCAICVFILAGCADGKRLSEFVSRVQMDSDEGSKATRRLRGNFSETEPELKIAHEATFLGAMQSAAIDPHDSALAKTYLKSGLALSDRLCSDHFRRLVRVQVRMDADRDLFSNVGTLSAVILGLSDVSSQVVGGVAGGFGFVEDTYTSEMANFLVSADISAVQELINLKRDDAASRLLRGTYDFYKAEMALIRYDDECSQAAIKRSINEAVGLTKASIIKDRTKPDVKAATANVSVMPIAMVEERISELFTNTPIVSNGDLVAIYSVLNRTMPIEIRSFLNAQLRNKGLVASNFKAGRGQDDLQQLLSHANANGALYRSSDVLLTKLRNSIAAQQDSEGTHESE